MNRNTQVSMNTEPYNMTLHSSNPGNDANRPLQKRQRIFSNPNFRNPYRSNYLTSTRCNNQSTDPTSIIGYPIDNIPVGIHTGNQKIAVGAFPVNNIPNGMNVNSRLRKSFTGKHKNTHGNQKIVMDGKASTDDKCHFTISWARSC